MVLDPVTVKTFVLLLTLIGAFGVLNPRTGFTCAMLLGLYLLLHIAVRP